jgi:hypothetical protein
VGSVLPGVVRETWLRGRRVYRDGEMMDPPSGELIFRPGSEGTRE